MKRWYYNVGHFGFIKNSTIVIALDTYFVRGNLSSGSRESSFRSTLGYGTPIRIYYRVYSHDIRNHEGINNSWLRVFSYSRCVSVQYNGT